VSGRKSLWIGFAEEKLGGLDPFERRLAEAAADVLASQAPDQMKLQALRDHEADCAAGVVAIVEVARAVARGDLKDFRVVQA